MPLTAEQQTSVVAAARSYLGVRWHGQGRSREEGVDCTGIVELSFHDGGMPVDIMKPRYQSVEPALLMRRITQFCSKLPKGEPPQLADVLIYGLPQEAHCAVIVGIGALHDGREWNIIHAPMHRKVVETRFDPARGIIRGIYRWRS